MMQKKECGDKATNLKGFEGRKNALMVKRKKLWEAIEAGTSEVPQDPYLHKTFNMTNSWRQTSR